MRVLVTNDDGVGAPGLEALVLSLKKRNHDVWIVAPSKNRSGVSHGISLSKPLEIIETEFQTFACSGKPADCVIAALSGLLPTAPDVVLSGINQGANLGTDVLFSGTVAAARQAAIYGIPGIAVSLVTEETGGSPGQPAENPFPRNDKPFLWGGLADFAVLNLENLMRLCSEDVFMNINALSSEKYQGFRMTTLCRRVYHDSMRISSVDIGRGKSGTVNLCGTKKKPFECVFEGGSINTLSVPEDDWDAVRDGFISVSSVSVQPVSFLQDENNLFMPDSCALCGTVLTGEGK